MFNKNNISLILDPTCTKLDLSTWPIDKITSFDFSQFSQLEELNISNLGLTQLPKRLPITLKKLICFGNNFKNTYSLLEIANLINLEYLNCSNCNLLSLNYVPPNLKILICRENEITLLDNLPLTLIILVCSLNLLTHIDYLPFGLQQLYCGYNQLKELPNLPPQLKILDCPRCLIKNLDCIPDSLEKVYCQNNLITKFARLPANLKELSCFGNPFIYTFAPTIRNINLSLYEH